MIWGYIFPQNKIGDYLNILKDHNIPSMDYFFPDGIFHDDNMINQAQIMTVVQGTWRFVFACGLPSKTRPELH